MIIITIITIIIYAFTALTLFVGDRKGIWRVKASGENSFGLAVNVSGQGAAQSTI